MNRYLAAGDEVAIMPSSTSLSAEVLEIAVIQYIGEVFMRLQDGRIYATIGGKSLAKQFLGFAVPATDEHQAALKSRGRKRPAE
jgi:hypothetical protein